MNQRLILIITAVVLILGLGGAAAWWQMAGHGQTEVVQGVEATPTASTPGPLVVKLPTATPALRSTATRQTRPTEAAVSVEGCITIRILNMRIGPGKEYPAAGGLGKGECVAFDARSADNLWLRVVDRLAERGDRLWAYAAYIEMRDEIDLLPVEE